MLRKLLLIGLVLISLISQTAWAGVTIEGDSSLIKQEYWLPKKAYLAFYHDSDGKISGYRVIFQANDGTLFKSWKMKNSNGTTQIFPFILEATLIIQNMNEVEKTGRWGFGRLDGNNSDTPEAYIDSTFSDISEDNYGIGIMHPEKLEGEKLYDYWYELKPGTFFPTDPADLDVILRFRLNIDLSVAKKFGYLESELDRDFVLGDYWNVAYNLEGIFGNPSVQDTGNHYSFAIKEYKPTATKPFSYYFVLGSMSGQLCQNSNFENSPSPVSSPEGCFSSSTQSELANMTNFNELSGTIDPIQPVSPLPTPQPSNPPNLKVREIKVYDANGTLLTERETVLIPGEVLDIRINIISLEENCSNGMEAGKDTVETDIYYKIALGDDLGSYQYLGRVYSEVWRLTEDNHHIEHFSYTVPAEAAGQRIYFRAKVDSTSEVTETDESDNYSGTDEWYAVDGDCDIIITKVALTNGKTALNEGEHYGIEAFVKNQGTTTCPFSTRLVYYEQKPGQTTWTEMATDGTDVAELVPGFIKHEYTIGEPFVANTPGTHNLMACGDYQKNQPETNENNNCKISEFTVTANRPNFYIHKIYFKVGSTTYQAGATIPRNSYIKPYVQMGNNGTSSVHGAFRVAYYVNADKYRDSDGVDANQVCVGCIVTEYVSTGFKLGDTGTRTYRACLDYQGNAAESNEGDNCQTITFYVR